jgi:MFS family permease
VITGYLLSLAAVIPVTGWAVRRYSARRPYLIALVVFTAGSALCALATSSGELIAFRVLQGVGGGMITPIGQMILVKAAGPRNLPRVMSFIGVPIVLAPVCCSSRRGSAVAWGCFSRVARLSGWAPAAHR